MATPAIPDWVRSFAQALLLSLIVGGLSWYTTVSVTQSQVADLRIQVADNRSTFNAFKDAAMAQFGAINAAAATRELQALREIQGITTSIAKQNEEVEQRRQARSEVIDDRLSELAQQSAVTQVQVQSAVKSVEALAGRVEDLTQALQRLLIPPGSPPSPSRR